MSQLFLKFRNREAFSQNCLWCGELFDTKKNKKSLCEYSLGCNVLDFRVRIVFLVFWVDVPNNSEISDFHRRAFTSVGGAPEACPDASIFTAAAPWMYCPRKKNRSSLWPLNFEYVSQIIPHYILDFKKWEKKIRMAHDGALLDP